MGLLARIFGRGAQSHRLLPAQALACIANRPMMMAPAALDSLLAAAAQIPERGATLIDDEYKEWITGGSPEDISEVVDGVGILTIRGPLFQRFGLESWWYGGLSYDVIGAAFDMLLANPKVQRIVLDIDSPGGSVSGCSELAAKIYAARGTKPLDAVANDMACSAAYELACACDRVHVSQTSTVGSIGVIATHVDVSRWNDRLGITYTSVTAGAKKADYSPNAPLGEGARSELQAEVDRLGDAFVALVAQYRGIDAEAVRGLQAGCLYGPAAITAGLADAIGTVESVGASAPKSATSSAQNSTAAAVPASAISGADAPASKTSGPLIAVTVSPLTPEQSAQIARATAIDHIQAAGLKPDLLAALIDPRAAVTLETVDARIEHARAVADLCVAAGAGMRSVAPDYITKNTPIETVRSQLLAAKAEDGPELVTSIPAKAAAAGVTSAQAVYDRRRQQQQNQ